MTLYYHYTSLDTLLKIIENRKLRFTNIGFMNDGNEFHYAIDIAQEFFPGLSDLNLRNHILPYWVLCASELQDSFSQWEMYGDKSRGVALGMELEYLPNAITRLGMPGSSTKGESLFHNRMETVVYSEDQQRELIKEAVDRLGLKADDGSFNSELLGEISHLATRFKQKQFEAEREMRCVQFYIAASVDDDELPAKKRKEIRQFNRNFIKYKIDDNCQLIPFLELDFTHLQIIKTIVLGPNFEKRQNSKLLKQLLWMNQLDHIQLVHSSIIGGV